MYNKESKDDLDISENSQQLINQKQNLKSEEREEKPIDKVVPEPIYYDSPELELSQIENFQPEMDQNPKRATQIFQPEEF